MPGLSCLDAEQNRVGPHLVGIFGREAGAVDGFNYSPAMANSGIVWDDDTIGEYLADPRGYIPGNRMAFAGLRNPEQIADVIAYMRSKQ
jgi:cytochrome c